MDKFRNMANDAMNSGLADKVKDIDFPVSKESLLSQLEQKGVPGQIIDRIRNVDASNFKSFEDLKQKAGF